MTASWSILPASANRCVYLTCNWNSGDLPRGPEEPELVLPIFVRHELSAILVLGAHVTGKDFDADEIRLLEACVVAAGAAYDHLEADALRKQTEELRRTIASMRNLLQAHGLTSVSS